METTLLIKQLLPMECFISKSNGNEIHKYGIVGEIPNSQYPHNIKMDVVGDDKWQQFAIEIGCAYKISFDLMSREWNGKWFTNATAWKVEKVEQEQPQQIASQPQPQVIQQPIAPPQTAPQTNDDIPF